jgi:threonine aldolase
MIDLVSDTKSQPSQGMREAMAQAIVGDEQYDEDPTTLALCKRVANLFHKEAAILLPSGTMCNLIAVRVHCEPGDEVITSSASHLVRAEAAGAAAFSGVMVRAIDTLNGTFRETLNKSTKTQLLRY